MTFKKRIHRILVIKNRAIGDTILTTGILRLLRKHYPDYQIHVLVRAPAGELLENLPYVDRIVSAKEPKGKIDRLAYWMRLVRRMRAKRYDMVLNFHASFRTSLTAQFLRAGKCVANHHELKGRNWFSDVKVPGRGEVKSIIERDLDVLRAIGIHASASEAMPEIILSPSEIKEAKSLLSEIEVKGRGPRVFLGIGGSRETKRWPASYFVSLAEKISDHFDANFVLSTIDLDEAWLQGFHALVEKNEKLRDRILHFKNAPLRQTAKIISQCQVYVGNDSGLKHLAIGLGLKTFTFFGPEAPQEWHPYDLKAHPYAYIDGLNCRTESGKHWCSISRCQKHQHRCMKEIQPFQVWSELERLLKG